MQRTMLIVGATGLIGRAALNFFHDRDDWRVISLSRRRPDLDADCHLGADLTNRTSLAACRASLAGVTHILYAALHEREDLVAGWRHQRQMQTNLAMFRNLMDLVSDCAGDLTHVSLLQGTKAYGIHVEPMRAPAKERWPRHPHENFYWLQEDELTQRQAGASWDYTIWRPQAVFGQAVGSPMNLIAALGVYASICRETGQPCRYPGGVPIVTEATDARLIARAVEWASGNPAAANQTFNITNGDVLLWPNLWPTLCTHFNVEPDLPGLQILTDTMPAMAPVWDSIVETHGLVNHSMHQLVGGSWQFLDRAMRAGAGHAPPSLVSTIKLRQAGFHDCLDTEDSLVYWLSEMQNARLLPR